VLQKVPVAKWLGLNVVLWGIATACTAAAKDYGTLLAARIFLGIFEAAIAPSLILVSSQWYTKSEAAPRFSIWYAGLGVGQIIGGIVSYAFQQVKNPTFQGWKIMFVVLGLVTIIIGFVTFFFLPDTPMKASWLSEAEKVMLLKHVAINQTGVDQKKVKPKQLIELLLDVQLWIMTILTILVSHCRIEVDKADHCSPDLNLQWCSHDLLGNVDQELRLQASASGAPQHALWRRVHHKYLCRGLRCSIYRKSLGLASAMLHARYHWRRLAVFCEGQGSPTGRHLSRQRYYCDLDYHISMDGIQCGRSHEASRCSCSHIRKFQRRKHHWPSNIPGQGRAQLHPCEDYCARNTGSRSCHGFRALPVLHVGEQA
jgi:hypothetical protein